MGEEMEDFEYQMRKKKNRKKRKDIKLVIKTNARNVESELADIASQNGLETEEDNSTNTSPGGAIGIDAIRYAEAQASYFHSPSPIEEKYLDPEPPIFEERPRLPTPINEKALRRFAPTYELERFKKNALLIFNQEDIDDDPRIGTHVDVEALTNTFEKFGFEVKDNIHHDLTKKEIMEKVEKFTSEDYTEYGCIGIVILTHGSRNGRLRAKDKVYSEIEIINHLKVGNKSTLVTKPKFVIIQACRGTKIKPPVPVFYSGIIRTDTDIDLEPYHLPEEADMLILHSCYVGSPAFRDEINGTWFIQTLCETIEQLAPAHDLETIITEVKRRVAIDKYEQERENLPMQMCQMPVLTSTLIRKLYLNKFGESTPLHAASVLPVTAGQQTQSTRRDSRLDEMATTPLLPTYGPCSCFLDHFSYMRDCLKHYVEANPEDVEAETFLDLANEYQDEEFNSRKQKMLKIIHNHLKNNAKSAEYYKYVHFCEKYF